jgi:hypothetical protein
MQAFYPSAAWQGKEADPGTKLFFERTPVEILGGIELLAEKKGIPQSVFFGIHNESPPKKKRGRQETSPSIIRHTIVPNDYFIPWVPNRVKKIIAFAVTLQ